MTSERSLTQIYEKRFSGHENYRKRVWKILIQNFFSKWIKSTDHILDLGCGYGEFINHIMCEVRHAMDLNPKQNHFWIKRSFSISRIALNHGK